MNKAVIIALVKALASDAVSDYFAKNTLPRGPRGHSGKAGRSFDAEEHRGLIVSELKEIFASSVDSLKLKFSDLSPAETGELKGKKGKDGKDGRDGSSFSFDDSKSEIKQLIQNHIDDISDSLKLTFDSLSDDEIGRLRGARGQKGSAGRNFSFEENRTEIESILLEQKLRFEDLTPSDITLLKLKFTDLTDEEKSQLSLNFDDLTDEQAESLRGRQGPRGQRGQKGDSGESGRDGSPGNQGEVGPKGPRGLKGDLGEAGVAGRDGIDGIQGEAGPKGSRGLKGDRGEAGVAGENGASGEAGPRGEKGDSGNEGEQGRQGPRGQKGPRGNNGEDGSNGSDGEKGAQGERGPRGQRGSKGIQGEAGQNGADGPMGPIGIAGVEGRTGPKGLPGHNGLDGEAGKNAPVVTSISPVQVGSKFYLRFKYSDGTHVDTDYIKLPEGKETVIQMFGGGGAGPSYSGNDIEDRVCAEDIEEGDFVTAINFREVILAQNTEKAKSVVLGIALNSGIAGAKITVMTFGQFKSSVFDGIPLNKSFFLGINGKIIITRPASGFLVRLGTSNGDGSGRIKIDEEIEI